MNYMVIKANRAFVGSRFDVSADEIKIIRWYAKTPRIVANARLQLPIEWAGSTVQDYTVLHDGTGLPKQFSYA